MQHWQQRVIDEQTDLAIKWDKLKTYIESEPFKALPEDVRILMQKQCNIMFDYITVLRQRIALFC